jgi:nicotinate dehydrogenase medium molybdopterin subunit
MKKRGRGIAAMFYPIGGTSTPVPAAVFVKVNTDGTAVVFTGANDIGQGSITIIGQIVAEELGIGFDQLKVVSGDTQLTPFDHGPGASRTTFITGNAAQRAAAEAKQILLEVAAEELNVSASGLDARGGFIYVKDLPERRWPIGAIAQKATKVKGRPPVGTGVFGAKTTKLDKKTGQGTPFQTFVYAAQIADVEVDTETGEVDVLKITAVHDCGTVINPLLAEGQVEGGVAMGYGYGMMEEMVLDHGRVKNPQFTDYLLPTALDVPQIVTALVERPDPAGPFGAKGIGEPSLLPTAPAIVNAIQDAIGVRIRDLPVTAEKVLNALNNQRRAAE